MASDNDDAKDDDDDNTNSEDVEVVEIGIGETLTMLHRLVNLKYLSKEETNFLVESAKRKAKPYQWSFYVRIKFVW